MNGLSTLSAAEVAGLNLVPKGSTVVDVGGAHGQLLAAVLEADPSLKGVLFDTAQVVATAAAEMTARGRADRCKLVAGDFFASAPAGDVYLLKHILHDWDDAQCVTILRNCRQAMNAGGRVLIVEMVLPEDDTPSMAQMMDINMLVLLPGKERTLAEYGDLCRAAGLKVTATHPTHSPYTVVEARAG
jgi:ubiquinone/menaquinone biosynthesis C-methylase UbiE